MLSSLNLSRFPLRRSGVSVVLLLLIGLLLTAVTPSATAAQRGPGFAIPLSGKAASGWMGAYALDTGLAYRISPTARRMKSGYGSPHLVADLGNSGKPSLRNTQRAAYILSVYGTRNDDIQAAAVDAAVLHLLAGGKWRISQPAGRKRMRASAQSRYVRSYAKTMLSRSKKYAGPVSRRVSASKTTVGSASRVSFTIRTASGGHGLAGLPVTFRYPGSAPFTLYTNAAGQAFAYITATSAQAAVTATVGQVPEWRLRVRNPKRANASPVADAGAKLSLTASTRILASGAQVVSVSNTASVISTGAALAGRYSIAGGEGTRTVTRSVRGPYGSSTTSCSGGIAYTSATSITANGAWSLPSYQPTKSGYYRWTVTSGGNAFSDSATGCGAAVRVRKQANVGQFRLAGDTNAVKLDKKFAIGVRVVGFDRSEVHTLTSRLYGPYSQKDNARCGASRLVSSKTVTKNVSTNGDVTMPSAVIGAKANVGWYAWQTTLNTGDLIIGDTSGCGVPFHVTQ